MDHLPLPSKPLLNTIEVPYCCIEPYDRRPMLRYPDRQAWQILYSPGGISYLKNDSKPSDSDLESFIQSWLYFGLLHEAFGKFSSPEEYTRQNAQGRTIVSTKKLEIDMKRWSTEMKALAEDRDRDETQMPEWIRVSRITSHVWKIALNTKSLLKETVVNPGIWLSIACLAEAIDKLILDFCNEMKLPSWPVAGTWRNPGNPGIGNFILDEMSEKGWCPFDVKKIDLTTKTAGALYYFGNLQPTRPKADHSKCNEHVCTAMTIDASYQAKHMIPDCDCSGDFSDIEAVISALEGDGYPLIQATSHDSQAAEFRVIECRPNETDFIAISHVWAEGLGNPQSNALPVCSLKWVSQLVNKLYRFPTSAPNSIQPFWLDTLCVPIATFSHENWLRAMNRLRFYYKDARHVLVLDSYLYAQNSTEISPLEIWARVLCCSWSRRLWTFQEARLAGNLHYQFADKAVRLEEIFVAMTESIAAESMVNELMVAYRASNVIRNLGEKVSSEISDNFRPEPDVWDMRESLKARAVSVSSDEALCLFCNMNMDMGLVTNLAPEDRMWTFWTMVRKIPVGLVFSTAKKKLTSKGLRWAPSSFMGDLDTPHWYIEQIIKPRVDGFPTPNGLHIQIPGYLFSSTFLKEDSSFDTLLAHQWLPLCGDDGLWYFVEMSGPWNQTRTTDPGGGEQLAILLVSSPGDLQDDVGDDPFGFVPGIQAVIGVVIAGYQEEERAHIEVYRHAMLHRFSKAFQIYHQEIYRCVEAFVLQELRWKGAEETVATEGEDLEANLEEMTMKEVDEGGETPENFEITDSRRVCCQKFATAFARSDPAARDITLMQGKNQQRTEEESYEHFGAMARFQLQMRIRNRILEIAQTQPWCID